MDEPTPRPEQRPNEGGARRGLRGFGARLRQAARWGTKGSPSLLWQLLVPVVFAVAGFLFVTSAESASGGELRADNAVSLTGLLERERSRVDDLRAQRTELEAQIEQLSGSVDDASLGQREERLGELRTAAGMGEMEGPAVKVTLDDAPYDQDVPDGFTANDLVVHQQDLQAVVNALWEGGAEGVMLQGQRIVATTGIKCVGNTVLLHGVPYAPPYEIVAVGEVTGLVSAVNSSDYINIYKDYAEPPVNIGYDLEVLDEETLPPYEGNVELAYAQTMD